MMIALATGREDFILTETEAKDLADAITILGKEYDVKLSGKTAATANLVFTAAVIYGPRVYLAMNAKKQAPARARNDSQVAAVLRPTVSPGAFPDPFGKS